MNIKSANKKLLLLLVVFVLGIVFQAGLNYSFSIANEKLDSKNKQLFTIGILGENIIRKLSDIESLFYKMAVSNKYRQRYLIQTEIDNNIKEVRSYLVLLEQGSEATRELNIDLPDIEAIMDDYSLKHNDTFKLIGLDISPKLDTITTQVQTLMQRLNALDKTNLEGRSTNQNIDDIRTFITSVSPLFANTVANASRIYYEFIEQKQVLEQEISSQKQTHKVLQIALTLLVIVLGFIGFYVVGRQMQKNNKQLKERQDYVNDLLSFQPNIILVNDGRRMLDVSGGFFNLFKKYSTIEGFLEEYSCISDTFVAEEGYLQQMMGAASWMEYAAARPKVHHKVKISYENTLTIFQVYCSKSEKYDRYIISMFDITEHEKTLQDIEVQKNTALKATKSKSEFLANMSHEIRTPLNAILGFIGLLKDKQLDDEAQQYVNTIDSSGQSLLAIINDVLDFSKIESGKIEVDNISFDSRYELTTIAELFKNQCLEKDITLHVNIDEDVPSQLYADILRIKQIITNLLSNAVKFTPRDKNIYFNVGYNNGALQCSVKDEGIGIDNSAQRHIFNEFSQAESSTTREYGGTGLGLAISSKLVSILHGEMKLTSKVGVGSEFSFSIPVKVATQSTTVTSKISDNSFQGNILLVEDNLTNQMLMKAILSKQGIQFDIANNGLEAVEMFKNGQYDLVLMDENMPKMQGTQATVIIREYEKDNNLQRTPIVALTASTVVSEREKFFAVGMDFYLSKPIELPRLLEVFTKYLNK